ncbi:MAG: hypothetical protein EXX96DRAFT_287681 [Benjaminiella poitrasii]|nr:MAG: hypothetical protein EXX96DRAFT_287681 [Benjaminiella poitrasii]
MNVVAMTKQYITRKTSLCIALKSCQKITYRMVAKKGQLMIPDFTLYLDPLTVTNFELFVVEVKNPGNISDGHLETDFVKLGKKMQLTLDKLLEKKVKNPEIVALLVEGNRLYLTNQFKHITKYI